MRIPQSNQTINVIKIASNLILVCNPLKQLVLNERNEEMVTVELNVELCYTQIDWISTNFHFTQTHQKECIEWKLQVMPNNIAFIDKT